MVTVADSGIGIPPEALSKLGKPFEQVQSPLTRNHKGSGLGLAISRSLVALHGGEMTIDSTQGVGTTVTVFLPARPALPPPPRPDQRFHLPRTVVMPELNPGIHFHA